MFRYAALGFIQGFTEFLPISSSGHLVIFQEVFGMEGPRTLLSALLHFGTLLSVLFIFRKRIRDIALSLFNGSRDDRKYLLNLIIATVPIVIVGLAAKGWIEASFSSTRVTGIGLLVTGTVLWSLRYVKRADKSLDNLTWRESIPVGLAQVGALFPGISRSGVTISAGLVKELDPDFAAEFSFLLMVPAVLGANVLKIGEGLLATSSNSVDIWGYVLGTATSAIAGMIAIKWLLAIIRRGNLTRFSYYCLPLGTAVVIWSLL
ncbi:undecaprenyl-diphosphate phosphatase [Candidatus Bipolaricaulota bacterium]|nr:undecaprenyl-diphosphate phosphatase [Candidatus Bipolaricaulota bacterium]